MKKPVWIVAAALLLAGCSGNTATQAASQLSANPPAPAPTSATAPSTPTPSTNARGNLSKKVGEVASIRGADGKTWVTFQVTKIEPNFKCTDQYASASENGNFIAITMDITTSKDLADSPSKNLYVSGSAFKVIGPDGTTENDSSSGASYGCIPSKQAVSGTIGPGEHVVGIVVLDSQYKSGGLAFTQPFMDGGWEWSF